MNLKDEIIHRIQGALTNAEVELADITGGNDHWEATIIASEFQGMSRLQRQRSIYAALGELMHGPIHALTFRTLTPEEHEAEN